MHRKRSWIPTDILRILDARRGEALAPLRSEIFGASRFAQHGLSLAVAHRVRKLAFVQGSFYPRLKNNLRTLRSAQEYITQQALTGHEISPAAEWLLDNFPLIEDQWREIRDGLPAHYYRSLPVLQDAPLVGLPRVYGLAWAFVTHTDSAFDETLLQHFLNAYQTVHELSQGELWALPTTLRVVLIENLRRLADRIAIHKAARELAIACASRPDGLTLHSARALQQMMVQRGVGSVFAIELMQQLVPHGNAALSTQQATLREWLANLVPDLAAAQTQQHIDQAADHLSMGNAVMALRSIGSAAWPDIVAQTSRVMLVMLEAPLFCAEDEFTRNKTLHAIERLSVASGQGESAVARALLRAMSTAHGNAALTSHWLEGEGRPELEHQLGIRYLLPKAWRHQARIPRTHAYFGTLLLGTLLLVWLFMANALDGGMAPASGAAVVGTLLLSLLPASQAVVALVNRLISEGTAPAHLSRLRLANGIPRSAQTLVVIPAMLSNLRAIEALVHRLLLHHLANVQACTQFALLSDWQDADQARQPTDDALLAHARQALESLNESYPVPAGDPARFLLLHRERSYSPTQRQWIGWERKRGKLEQLIAALATDTPGPFMDLGVLSRMAVQTRYVMTLDSDTELPPGRLRSLVGVAEHPQNQPILAADGRHVTSGYGILQPRVVAPLPTQGKPTAWQWLFAHHQGLDPYSAMTSDVYQDVFNEGSFTGKGLLHVATLHAVLGGRIPIEQVLSHDLLEGSLVRCGVVTDITLIEAHPTHADAASSRLHRWTRGDWQLLPFLLHSAPWPLGSINRWKLLDNLRRSLVAPSCIALLVWAMAGQGLSLVAALALTVAACCGGSLMGAIAGAIPAHKALTNMRFAHAAGIDLARALAAALWETLSLLHQALLSGDAVVRTLYRLLVSRRHLLAWTTADIAQAALGKGLAATLLRHWPGPALALGLLAAMVLTDHPPEPLAMVLLSAWGCAPLLLWASNTPWTWMQGTALRASDVTYLHGVARDTWRLFERCVDESNHHLPPDNLQTLPLEALAQRTSPTNIGLYLLSAASARQMGWIGTQELLARLEATLGTLDTLERYRGHFLNWYDTRTQLPLLPRYVSTVDSGNLSAHLLTVAQACRALAHAPHDPAAAFKARRRSLERLYGHAALLHALQQGPPASSLIGWMLTAQPSEAIHAQAWDALVRHAAAELQRLFPALPATTLAHTATEREHLHWLLTDHLALLRSAGQDRQAAGPAGDTLAHVRLQALAKAFECMAWASDFRFLYHAKRQLMHIGYRVEDQHLDPGFYDLLASESHLTSLLAIAKGDLPVRHWAALGRPFFASGRHAVLRSWSGSMFEYLMPTLVLASPDGSALQEAGESALREQRAFGQAHQRPWGVSECAHAGRDTALTYQYAPQGVPRLAQRRTPPTEHVVAPYASALAALVDARAACQNLRALATLSASGRYGFIEALDFSPARQSRGERYTPVNTYMAHHQGMTIVALTNVLLKGVVQDWGRSHPRMEAMGSLLHERAPRELPAAPPQARLPLKAMQRRTSEPSRLLVPGTEPLEPTQLMSNGRYTLTIRSNGAGWSRLGQAGITRWRDDALRDDHGSFVYVRRTSQSPLISVTSHPAPDPLAAYSCCLGIDRVSFDATWNDLRAHTTVWVSPEDDVELRKIVLTNLGKERLEFELISALDITLATHEADEAHPAFSGLFVTADWNPGQCSLRFARAPRLPTEQPIWAAHFVAETQGTVLGVQVQADRQHWRGRHQPASHPQAQLEPAPLGPASLATGLDPVAVLGLRLEVLPGAQATVTFATAASHDENTLSAMIDKYREASYVERSSTVSATLAGIVASTHQPHSDYLPAQQALTTALVLTLPRLDLSAPTVHRAPAAMIDKRLLWPLGLSGERPILLLHIGPTRGLPLLRLMGRLLRAWSRAGIACDLVVLSRESHSYHMPMQQACVQMSEQHQSDIAQQPGPAVAGLHVLHHDSLTPGQINTLTQLARVPLHADGRTLLSQVNAWRAHHARSMAYPGRGQRLEPVPVRSHPEPSHQGAGAFEASHGAFAFEVGEGQQPTRPWINVLANPSLGCIVTDSGAGNTWALNSRLNQLTAWSNDPVADPPSEWWLVQDSRSGEAWSLTPSAWGYPTGTSRITHTQGLTTITHHGNAMSSTVRWCVDSETAIKQIRIQLTNHGSTPLQLRLVGMVEWMLGEKRRDRASLHTTAYGTEDLAPLVLLCTQTDQSGGLGGGTAFLCESRSEQAAALGEGWDWTHNRAAFFDSQGHLVLPHTLGQQAGAGLDPCAALSHRFTLPAGEAFEQTFLLGYAASADAALQLARQALLRCPSDREAAQLAHWDALLQTIQVHTPDPLFDVLVNRWLLYQTVSSRLWAKGAFYQAGGATGYRDQLQDCMALAWAAPETLRAQIVACASRQFEAGDVQHWWHTPGGAGVRTHFSDDLLWLPFACEHYLRATGDRTVLNHEVPFLDGSAIPEGAEDIYESPRIGPVGASIYEHAARTLDRSLLVGPHGLPLMGGGDWNDGMNRVGHGGRGESVWLAWFLCTIVAQWAPLARERGEAIRAATWDAAHHGWLQALQGAAWDGQWYRRAFFDDGSPLGSHTQPEARIDLIAQAWSVLASPCGAPPWHERQHQAMQAVRTHLADAENGLMRLLAPALRDASPSAGYIQAYPPGVRENGGQYAHAAVWALMASATLAQNGGAAPGACDLPYEYFTWISPAHRAAHPDWGPSYRLEPYAVAADVYSMPPYVGWGGWSWYTGAAGWLHRAAIESIFGLQLQAQTLWFQPCLPSHWSRAELSLRRDARLMRFVLVRGTEAQALAACNDPKAATLKVGERLHWNQLPEHSCFSIAIAPQQAPAA